MKFAQLYHSMCFFLLISWQNREWAIAQMSLYGIYGFAIS